jgi:L-amino acid N-acyltransferase YncA
MQIYANEKKKKRKKKKRFQLFENCEQKQNKKKTVKIVGCQNKQKIYIAIYIYIFELTAVAWWTVDGAIRLRHALQKKKKKKKQPQVLVKKLEKKKHKILCSKFKSHRRSLGRH